MPSVHRSVLRACCGCPVSAVVLQLADGFHLPKTHGSFQHGRHIRASVHAACCVQVNESRTSSPFAVQCHSGLPTHRHRHRHRFVVRATQIIRNTMFANSKQATTRCNQTPYNDQQSVRLSISADRLHLLGLPNTVSDAMDQDRIIAPRKAMYKYS